MNFEKLKHEWKSFALQVIGLLVGLHDAAIAAGVDWSPFIPEQYRPYALPVIMTFILFVRRYV